MSGFTEVQTAQLLEPIRPSRVFQSQGHSNVAAWDVTAHLTRMFGFGGWEKEVLALDLISERTGEQLGLFDQKGQPKTGWYVTYRCLMRLRVRNPAGELVCSIDDAATGSASNLPSLGDAHDFAVKNAISYALKRCAKDLGDQFGLSLYNGGKTNAVVVKTLVAPAHTTDRAEPEVDSEGYGPGEEPFE